MSVGDRFCICFVIPSLGDGGAQRQCIGLLNELQGNPDLDIHLILLGEGRNEWRLATKSLTIHRTSQRNFASVGALRFVHRTLKLIDPDVTMSWLHPADILVGAALLARPRAWVMAERDSSYPSDLKYRVRSLLARRASLIVANSEAGAQYWHAKLPGRIVEVIPNIVLVDAASAARTDGSQTILSVGRLEPQKNASALLRSFARFASVNSDARLKFVGAGSEELALRKLATDLRVETRVEFAGFLDDVQEEMNGARLLATLSRHEGMPNILIEAVASGLPVVASDIPEHRAILGPDYPYLVNLNGGPGDAADSLERLWENPSAADALEHGRDEIAGLTAARIAARYLNALREIARTTGARPLRRADVA